MEFVNEILWSTWVCFAALLVYIIRLDKLKGSEVMILVIIGLNVLSDFSSIYLQLIELPSGVVYNVLAPSERILTLLIYATNSRFRTDRFRNYMGIILITVISVVGLFYYPSFSDMQRGPYVWAGLVVALLSYLHLRSIALDEAGQSQIMFVFSLANLVYYTLMISAQSAVDLAWDLDVDFGKDIYLVNDISFALWSIILIIGILWNRKN